jgi:nucleotide-binding universal stress UspA family protein
MKSILALTDFTASSLNAVNYAADLAVTINANLVLLHAIPFPIAVSEISVPGDFIDDMMDASHRDMNDLAEAIRSRTKGRITITTELKIGTVEQEIENLSSKERPLAVVLGIRSGKSLERALMGSTTFHIMNHVGFPTLIIPEDVQFKGIKSIGMACDLKKTNTQLPFETIKEWLSLFTSTLDIIHIENRSGILHWEQTAESIAIQNRLQHFKPHFHFLNGPDLNKELADFIKGHPLDLLMVFPRKHGIFGLFHKKRSTDIVNHFRLPILSIHDVSR